jgi:hypothetical protein
MKATKQHNSNGEPWSVNEYGVLTNPDREVLYSCGKPHWTGYKAVITVGWLDNGKDVAGWYYGTGLSTPTSGSHGGCWTGKRYVKNEETQFYRTVETWSSYQQARQQAINYVLKRCDENFFEKHSKKIKGHIISQTTQTTLF